jgi:hypothetical protein
VIITEHLQWFHLPKTAGTTTDELFLRSGVPLLWRDSQASAAKHLPASEHPEASALLREDRRNVINIRRLPDWLLSNYQHKTQRMGLRLDFEPVRQGYFYRHRQQEWLPADWWLTRFAVDDDWQFLRVEHLKPDFLRLVQTQEAVGLRGRLAISLTTARNRTRYARGAQSSFTPGDVASMRRTNPLWARFQARLYEDHPDASA